MAHGAPDWWGQNVVDIIAQTLASMQVDVYAQTLEHVTNRPTYGAADISSFNLLCGAMATTTLCTVTGAGIIYGGYMWSYAGADHGTDVGLIVIDGNTLSTMALQDLLNRRFCQLGSMPVYLTQFDDVNYNYAVGISYGITFESSAVLKWENNRASTLWVKGDLIYATV